MSTPETVVSAESPPEARVSPVHGVDLGEAFRSGRAFLNWWGGELGALIPAFLRSRWRAASLLPVIRVAPTAYRVEVPVVKNGRLAYRPVAEIGRDANSGWLNETSHAGAIKALRESTGSSSPKYLVVLPPPMAILKTVTLPSAVEENLREAVEFELDRLTPFSPEKLYFDARVVSRNSAARTCSVALAYAPRRTVDEHVNRLAGWQVNVGAVAPQGAEESGLNMLAQRESAPARRRGIALAWLLAAALAALAVALPIWQKRELAIAINAQVERARQQAEKVDAVRREAAALEKQYNALLSRKFAFPPAVQIIEEVTRLLPDDTWLAQFDIRASGRGKDAQRELAIRGDTANVGRLISLLESSTLIVGAAPRSPTLKLQPGPGEAFDLGAKVKPLALPTALPVGVAARVPASPPPSKDRAATEAAKGAARPPAPRSAAPEGGRQ